MSFLTLSTSQIAAEEPVTQDLLTTTKDNFDDHETRLLAAESTVLTTFPITFHIIGPHYNFAAATAVTGCRVPFNLTLTGAKLFIPKAGTSGTLQVDVQFQRVSGFTTIFTTKPSLLYSVGDNATSTNAAINAGVASLQAGDQLRLDISAVQVGCPMAILYLTYTVG